MGPRSVGKTWRGLILLCRLEEGCYQKQTSRGGKKRWPLVKKIDHPALRCWKNTRPRFTFIRGARNRKNRRRACCTVILQLHLRAADVHRRPPWGKTRLGIPRDNVGQDRRASNGGERCQGNKWILQSSVTCHCNHVGWTPKRYRRVSCKCAETSLQSSGARTRFVNADPAFLPSFTPFPSSTIDQPSTSRIHYHRRSSLRFNYQYHFGTIERWIFGFSWFVCSRESWDFND